MTVSIRACNKTVTELLFMGFEKVIRSSAQGQVPKCLMGNTLASSVPFKNISAEQMTEHRTPTPTAHWSFPLTFWLYFWNFATSILQNGNITGPVPQQLWGMKETTEVSLWSFHHDPGGMKRTHPVGNWGVHGHISEYTFHQLLALCLAETRSQWIIETCRWCQTFHFMPSFYPLPSPYTLLKWHWRCFLSLFLPICWWRSLKAWT